MNRVTRRIDSQCGKGLTRRQPFRPYRYLDQFMERSATHGLHIGQAAKAAGMSKTSILRSIKAGRISAGRDEFGQYAIEPFTHTSHTTTIRGTVPGNEP